MSPAMVRFHIPLIEPDMRFSRIRLSDKGLRFCPREVARSAFQADQSQPLIEILVGILHHTRAALSVMFPAQPLTQPIPRVLIHRAAG